MRKLPSPDQLADCLARIQRLPVQTSGGLVPLCSANKWFTLRMQPHWRRLEERLDLRKLGFDPCSLSAHQRVALAETEVAINLCLRPMARALVLRFGNAGQSLGLNMHGTRVCLTGTDWHHRELLSPADLLGFLRQLFRTLSDARRGWPRISTDDPTWYVEWEDSSTRWCVPGCCPEDAVQRLEVLAEAIDCSLRMPRRAGLTIEQTAGLRALDP